MRRNSVTWCFQVRLKNENCQTVALIIYEKYPQGIPVIQTFSLSQKQFFHTGFFPSLFLMKKKSHISNTSWYSDCLQFNPPMIKLYFPCILILMKHWLQQLPLVLLGGISSTTGIKSGVIKDLVLETSLHT